DRRPGEADHRVDSERCGGPCGVLDLLCGTGAHPLGVAVTPDVGGQDPLVPLVDGVVADGLPGQVAGDRVDGEAVLLEDLPAPGHVVVLRDGPAYVEVVAPAGDLETVVAPAGGEPADLLEGQVGELPREQRDRP